MNIRQSIDDLIGLYAILGIIGAIATVAAIVLWVVLRLMA